MEKCIVDNLLAVNDMILIKRVLCGIPLSNEKTICMGMWRLLQSRCIIPAFYFCLLLAADAPLTAQEKYEGLSGKYYASVSSQGTFVELESDPISSKFSQTSSVKVVYELKSNRIFYTHSVWYPYHYSFCKYVLRYKGSLYEFNQANYFITKEREYILGTINHFQATDNYVLEFSVADELEPNQIVKLHEALGHSFFRKNIPILRSELLPLRELEALGMPLIGPEEIYNDQIYQSVNEESSYGVLQYFRKDTKLDELDPHPILVLDGSTNIFPVCEGAIASGFQTPLSHISLLCKNRGTPLIALRDLESRRDIHSLVDSLVYFRVTDSGYELRRASMSEAEKYWKKQKNRQDVELRRSLKERALLRADQLNYNDRKFIGNKAALFSELTNVRSEQYVQAPIPEGAFAIPFFWFDEHLKSSGAQWLIDSLKTIQEVAGCLELLRQIRMKIKAQPVDRELLCMIDSMIVEGGSSGRMRFRSSTNAEDLEGFNGAGLYRSATGILNDSRRSVEAAVRKVWASTWTDRAFLERQYYGIEEGSVAMGILVHRSFPDEKANGVCITQNLYREDSPGFVFNVQIGELSVVDPSNTVVCDQFICYSNSDFEFYKDKEIVEYITRSSETEGASVLSNKEIVGITSYLSEVENHFFKFYAGKNLVFEDFALDIEFKIDREDRSFYIKQLRPFF